MSKKQIKIYLSLLLLVLSYLWWQLGDQVKYLQVNFLDVGQGDAILITAPSGEVILVDGGPNNKLLAQMSKFLPWWERTIDYLVISHWDDDHYIGLIQVLKKYEVKNILVSYLPDISSPSYLAWQDALGQEGISPKILKAGETWQGVNNLSWQIVAASDDKNLEDNDKSLVLRLSYGQTDFLLSGDLPTEQEEKLLANKINLEAEVLKVGHHGSKYSSSQEFLNSVEPKACIISAGADNKFGHPHPETLERLAKVKCNIYETSKLGNISILSNGEYWWLK
jgi:competence protein ComEC